MNSGKRRETEMMTRYEKEQRRRERHDELTTCIWNAFTIFLFGEFSLWAYVADEEVEIAFFALGVISMVGSLIVIINALLELTKRR